MSITQLILIILAVVAIVWGIYTLLKSIRQKNQDVLATDAIEHDKDGLPIIPRHQRPEPQESQLFKAEITSDNPKGEVKLSADDTELHLDNYPANGGFANANANATKSANDKLLAETHTFVENENDAFSMLANATETITPVVHTFDENQLKKDSFTDNSPILDTHIQAQIDEEQNSPLNNAIQNINISIFPNQQFVDIKGDYLLELIDKYGLKFGAMNMFHRYENKDGTGLLWFSLMMIDNEGISPFDLNRLPTQTMKGLVLFLSLPHPRPVQGFDSMMSIAGLLANDLNATVYDDTGEPINKENTQAMRELAINFGR
ncbi:cell division protein ZipA C-terminal FtsZ-binding domain-containing protein [Moraxella osloensis]|jgi:cell division protein ZipA|uniref:cell division protein ZipA C-terminal FtsZ-binding domain-containing protein n=1 Tax=Faucicola osloensis TaxID=34062 RepID=UPI000BA51BDC|nr:cell division protein ZipA C-terminal FtsZ-binding domain-containing protein [Moraxella osloensis]MCK6052048.1 cell division protein FtsZ [Moraxella osloensis]PAL14075.1 cell division protein FtsZ [Moraxella osloensis]